jgi:hypothetical protein
VNEDRYLWANDRKMMQRPANFVLKKRYIAIVSGADMNNVRSGCYFPGAVAAAYDD